MPGVPDSRALREIPLFNNLGDDELADINTRLHRKQFHAGANVVSVETPGEVVFLIVSGTLKIKVDQADGSEVIIAVLGQGEIVGELSVLDSVGRSADAIAQEDSTLLWLDRGSFDEFIHKYPVIMQNLLRLLSRRIRLSTEQIQALCTLDVYGKVARQLLVFGQQYGIQNEDGVLIPIRLTQSDIAGLVGASRERVNQVFVDLRKRDLITVDSAYRVTIMKPAELRKILDLR